jgi:hypothetical protein
MKAFTTILSLLASASSAFGALQQVTGFGTNPTGVQMYISVPAKVATNPAIIVAVSFILLSLKWLVAHHALIAPPLWRYSISVV